MQSGKFYALASLLLLVLLVFPAFARASNWVAPAKTFAPKHCTAQMPGNKPIGIENKAITENAIPLCYKTFVILYSPTSKTPIWVAEKLNPKVVYSAFKMERDDAFHEDPALKETATAELDDYVHSGYDRGHLAPSGDQPNITAQANSFSLANIAPQAPGLNRGDWAQLEYNIRGYATNARVYVVTGVLFKGAQIGFLKGQVAVPTHFWKLVYDPYTDYGVVYVAANNNDSVPRTITVGRFEKRNGVDFHIKVDGVLVLPDL